MRFGQSSGPEPEVPTAFKYVWDWFWELAARRQSGAGGSNPFTFTEIASWSSSMGIVTREEEVRMLLHMDDVYLDVSSEELEAARRRKQDAAPASKLRK